MNIRRRQVLTGAAVLASSPLLGRYGRDLKAKNLFKASDLDHKHQVDRLRPIILDKAKSLGADFADTRFSYVRELKVDYLRLTLNEQLAIGVRVLVNGYWGFCCTPVWEEKDVIKIVEQAYDQAYGNSQGPKRELDSSLFHLPGESGEWIMPVKHDPMERNPYEFDDYLKGMHSFIGRLPSQTDQYQLSMNFQVTDLWYGATNGASQYQKLYYTDGSLGFRVRVNNYTRFDHEGLSTVGMGYELFTDEDHFEAIRKGYDEAFEYSKIAAIPVDIGRYPIVLTGNGAGVALGSSVACAVELDRILGYEANAGGTSYIPDVSAVGSFPLAHSSLNITCNRSDPGGAGTRRWDDEGRPSSSGSIVKDGIVSGTFSDTEFSVMIPDRAIQGNFISPDARFPAVVSPGNIVVEHNAGNSDMGINDLLGELDRGLFFKRTGVGLDYQLNSGMLTGQIYEVKKGRLVSQMTGAGCWFKTTELWKNLMHIGGASTVRRVGTGTLKGEPALSAPFSVTAPAVLIKDASIIDITRK